MQRILVVEDESAMRTILADCLQRRGYRVLTAPDGAAGLRRATEERPDLILLDLMMPKLDGYAVCQELRRLKIRTPILVLTARGRVEDRVRGLDLGADDYLVKPFSRDELLARVRALLRRHQEAESAPATFRFGDLQVDLAARRVVRQGAEVALAPKEFDALALLLRHAGRVVTREEFLDRVWGCTAFPTTRTVDKHIAALRQKLEADPAAPRWIHTLHGVGYLWEMRQ
ncbi:MAG: response regulator transcription factor [Verrucomicrobia bacterium]|nr:response regulator transcription factor [Verrucomicrobiota bacterium]